MRAARLAFILAATTLAGCAEGPFVEQSTVTSQVNKPESTIFISGMVSVCFNASNSWAQVEQTASDACSDYGYFARHAYTQYNQCRWTAPHKAVFNCYHPDMTDAAGKLINPSKTAIVEEWERRTGKIRPQRRVATPGGAKNPDYVPPIVLPLVPTAPQLNGPQNNSANTAAKAAASSDTPAAPAPTGTAPEMDTSTATAAPQTTPAAPPPSISDFVLPLDSWGQHFEQ